MVGRKYEGIVSLILMVGSLFLAKGTAQETKPSVCQYRFALTGPAGGAQAWPEGAKQWWDQKGKQKFRRFCEAQPQDADFIIAWDRAQELASRPILRVGPEQDCDSTPDVTTCTTDDDGRQLCSTVRGQTTCVLRKMWDSERVFVDRISAAVCRQRSPSTRFEQLATVTRDSATVDNKLDRGLAKDFLQGALKALRKHAPKPSRRPERPSCSPKGH